MATMGQAAGGLVPDPAKRETVEPAILWSVMRTFALLAAMPLLAAAPAVHFAGHTIASDLRGGYQVVAADLNGDGKPDLLALASGMPELAWYENPTWERHVLAGGLSRAINCVVVPEPGDRIPQVVLATEFSSRAKDSPGVVSLLHHEGDPRRLWRVREIDRLPTSHRLRLAHIDRGAPAVVNAPLTAGEAEPPDYRGQTPLVYYRAGEWKRRLISEENRGVVHGLLITDWEGDGRDDILTASFEGIHRFRLGADGWSRTRLAAGDPSPWPKSGASDLALGRLGGERFLAAIEPWHGNQLAIYREREGAQQREVIDTALGEGHTLVAADLNRDGFDELIAGDRGKPRSVYIYAVDAARQWTRTALDAGGLAASSCAVVDLDGDQRPDVVCIGGTTLRWYENLGTGGRQ